MFKNNPGSSFCFRLLVSIINVCFISTTLLVPSRTWAQSPADLNLPIPGSMVNLSPAYMPVLVKGLRIHPENPILFDFMVDTGNSGLSTDSLELKVESQKLIKYFLASLTIPENDLWVNLSPYEKDRTIPQQLGQTEMGRDMLAQDYVLKQLTASLIYPEKNLGKEFWNKVYAKTQELYGSTQIPVNTFNKVWILADKAKVYVHDNTAFVVASHLKVMLEEDYLALQKHSAISPSLVKEGVRGSSAAPQGNNPHALASQAIRQIILPELEHEVNTGKNFSNLRQIFNSMILAAWYKKSLKESLLNQVYSNKGKVNGIDVQDKTIKEQIYQEYLKAYKKGVFNYIKEDVINGQMTPRKYFSGGEHGVTGDEIQVVGTSDSDFAMFTSGLGSIVDVQAETPQAKNNSDKAMSGQRPQGYPERNAANPLTYTSQEVLDNARSRENPDGWADPDLDNPNLSPAERNRLKEEIRAFIQEFAPETKFVNGRPTNMVETGLNGRGDLGWYGPNLAEDGIVFRYNQNGEIEFLAGKRDDGSEGLSLAGQFSQRNQVGKDYVGVTASKAVYREFNAKIDFKKDGLLVDEGPSEDWRNTNGSWVVKRVMAVLYTYEESLRLDIKAKKGMQEDSVRWFSAKDTKQVFFANQRESIEKGLAKIAAGQLMTSEENVTKEFDELTMGIDQLDEAYDAFRAGKDKYQDTYDVVIPKTPHGGTYYVAAGLEETLADIRRRRFTPEHIEGLKKLGRYSDAFLKYLSNFIFEGDISALREGTVVTADVPLMRITATPVEIKLLEGLIENRMAFNTNIATKTSRIVQAAQGEFVSPEDRDRLIREERFDPVKTRAVIDYGQRRAQERAGTGASRSAIIGGAVATSNVKAAMQHYLELSGTMAHAFIMMLPPEEEIEAYRIYAEAFPDSSTFLIDTYDTIEGAKKAIIVAKEMEAKGHRLVGVRLDSGDLVTLSKEVRKMFDDAGLYYVKIFASDDLNEDRITELLSKGARIDGFGVGTNLITGGKQAALEMKIVESDQRRYWRVHQNQGKIQKFITTAQGRVPMAGYSEDIEEMLFPYWIKGERVNDAEKPWQAHLRSEADMKRLKPINKQLSDAQPIPLEARDNPLSLNPQTDDYLAVDIQGAFLRRGGLAVKDADDILKYNRLIMSLFPKANRFASIDKHPWGHVSLASSYIGLPPLATVLTPEFIAGWTEKNNPIAPHALFNLSDLHVYLEGGFKPEEYKQIVKDTGALLQELKNRGYVNQYGVKLPLFNEMPSDNFILSEKFKSQRIQIFKTLKEHKGVGFQVLWTDHALEESTEASLHYSMLEKEFNYIVTKGMDGKDDSYSPFASNAGVPTELDRQIRNEKRGFKRRLFITGLAEDYCVGFAAISAAKQGYDEVYVVMDATKPVGFPPGSIKRMHDEFKKLGIKLITTKELIDANQNLGVKIATRHETPIGHPTIFEEDANTSLEEDFYHLTMGQAMFNRGFHKHQATFDYFYRTPPFEEPYVIVSGVKTFIKDLMNFKFTEKEISFLRSTNKFTEPYLKFLANYRFKGDIYGLKEGSVAFPKESIATVKGTMFDIVIETLMLKDMNFPTLDATWANHLVLENPDQQRVEAGISTAQGRAHKTASSSTFVGGFNRTTNLDAHFAYGIPLATRNDEGERFEGNILTGGRKSAQGGVFKLSTFGGKGRAKISRANPSKASLQGDKRSFDIVDSDGHLVDLMIGEAKGDNLGLPKGLKAIVRQVPWVLKGKQQNLGGDVFDDQEFRQAQVERYKGISSVSISPKLKAKQEALIDQVQALEPIGEQNQSMDSSFKNPGGIDLNTNRMTLEQSGEKIQFNFNKAMIAQFRRGDFSGITPVIIRISPIEISSLLGVVFK